MIAHTVPYALIWPYQQRNWDSHTDFPCSYGHPLFQGYGRVRLRVPHGTRDCWALKHIRHIALMSLRHMSCFNIFLYCMGPVDSLFPVLIQINRINIHRPAYPARFGQGVQDGHHLRQHRVQRAALGSVQQQLRAV